MALIDCAECGNQVSELAAACPKCGAPVSAQSVTRPVAAAEKTVTTQQTSKVYKAHQLWATLWCVVAVIGAVAADAPEAKSMWFLGLFAGAAWFIGARAMAWWNHG